MGAKRSRSAKYWGGHWGFEDSGYRPIFGAEMRKLNIIFADCGYLSHFSGMRIYSIDQGEEENKESNGEEENELPRKVTKKLSNAAAQQTVIKQKKKAAKERNNNEKATEGPMLESFQSMIKEVNMTTGDDAPTFWERRVKIAEFLTH